MTERSSRATTAYIVELEDRIDQLEASLAIARTKNDEFVPHDVVSAILQDENPVRVWRKYRGLTLEGLSNLTSRGGRRVDLAYISEIERGVKPGSIAALRALATALAVDLDDLAPARTAPSPRRSKTYMSRLGHKKRAARSHREKLGKR